MKRTIGIIMIVLFGLPMVYFNIIGVYWVGVIFGFFVGAGIVLAAQREFTIISSELKEENGMFRLHVTVKNKQKRATLIWFVANIYYRGASVGLANSTNLVLDSYGTGELVALVQLPIEDARLEDISWKIVRWNFK